MKKLLSGITVACLVSLFTVGSAVVAQEDPIFDILKGNFGGETGAIAGGISEPLITAAAGISEALVTTLPDILNPDILNPDILNPYEGTAPH